MISLMPKRTHRRLFELQLTAMIDIFSMIIIFLIKGTMFGVSDIAVPEGVRLPQSFSKESVESAPQVMIAQKQVRFSFREGAIPIEAFANDRGEDPRMGSLRQELKTYVNQLSGVARSSGALLNVIADRETPYRDVFNTVRVMRQSGFEAMLFVAMGPDEKSGVK